MVDRLDDGGPCVTIKRKLGKKFRKMIPIYEYFGQHWDFDFSDDMLHELYHYESSGVGTISPMNGYANAKKWMDVTISMWREDITKGLLFVWELYADPALPDWWLDKILVDFDRTIDKFRV